MMNLPPHAHPFNRHQTIPPLEPARVRLFEALLELIERLKLMATYNTAALEAAQTALAAAVTETLATAPATGPDPAAQSVIDAAAAFDVAQTARLKPAAPVIP